MFCAFHGLLLHFKLIPEGVNDKGDNPLVEIERAKVLISAVSRLYLGCISGAYRPRIGCISGIHLGRISGVCRVYISVVSRQARELRKISMNASANGDAEVAAA